MSGGFLLPLMLAGAALLPAPVFSQQLLIQSLDGPVTPGEIDAFKTYMRGMKPAASNLRNAYVYGGTGRAAEAFGMMYRITGDVAFLDKMIEFADGMLAGRNDPVSGRLLREGRRYLAWPNKSATDANAAYAGTENGDVVGHIAWCARLILETPALWDKATIADPRGFGRTYKERALRYVREMERTLDDFVVPTQVRKDLLRFYDGDYAAPWNQVSMLANGFQRLAECHALLGDEPAKTAFYYSVVKASYDHLQKMVVPYQSQGKPCYKWAYPQNENPIKHMEDLGHSAYDIVGIYRAWQNPRTAMPEPVMQAFANTLRYAIYQGDGTFASRVDGSNNAGEGNYDHIHAEWLLMAPWFPDFFATAAKTDLARAKNGPDFTSIILYGKWLRSGGKDAPFATGIRATLATAASPRHRLPAFTLDGRRIRHAGMSGIPFLR